MTCTKGYKLPPTYSLGNPGNGCILMPPGHPRYFVRSIFTSHGNNPPYGRPCYYLNGNGYTELTDVDKLFGGKSFPRLPIDHPRTRAWILTLYFHYHKCYKDPALTGTHSDMHIYPVPDYKLKQFHDDPRFSDEWRTKAKLEVEQYNIEIISQTEAIAIPENHAAVVMIREYYPDYQPDIDLIQQPTKHERPGSWWERLAERPTPDKCPGESWHKHPVNGKWCQVCGWKESDDAGRSE